MSYPLHPAVTALLSLWLAPPDVTQSFDRTLTVPERRIVAAWSGGSTGRVQAFAARTPWPAVTSSLTVGAFPRLRYAMGLIFAVSPESGSISVIDAATWTILREFQFGASSELQDIAVVSRGRAFVSRRAATHLLQLDLETGAASNAADLSIFADADGLPEMTMLLLHESRLYVQLGRIDRQGNEPVAPAMLAVVDAATGQLMDADPSQPGAQAIALAGKPPKMRMQVAPHSRRLLLSATGQMWQAGGIEMIDLDTLSSHGYVADEAKDNLGADVGPFVMISSETGYLAATTDLIESTHMLRFTISGGVQQGPDLFTSVGMLAPVIVHDAIEGVLYIPVGEGGANGFHVLDAVSAQRLTSEPVATPSPPSDLAIMVAGCGTGCDLNGDGNCDGADIRNFVDCIDEVGIACLCADFDASGTIDALDAALLITTLLEPGGL